MSEDSLLLFKDLINENGRAIPVSHPDAVQIAIRFRKALDEIEEALKKGDSDADSQGSSI